MILSDYLFNYLLERTHLIEKKQEDNKKEKKQGELKYALPKWIRSVVFGPFNPFYVYYIFLQNRRKGSSIVLKHNAFSINFLSYLIKNKDDSFNLEEYYNKEDVPVVTRYIKHRIGAAINIEGLTVYLKNFLFDFEKGLIAQYNNFKKSVKKGKGGFYVNYQSNTFILSVNRFDPYVFVGKYGLNEIPVNILKSIENKIFLDIGAYNGDTAIMLQQFKPKHTFCYEPVSKNLEDLKRTISLNNLQNTITVKNIALSNKIGEVKIIIDDAGSKLLENESNHQVETVRASTIDSECRKLNIGLIKMDVEGMERFVIQGGMQTIRNNNPILLISLYHTGADFFTIPMMLRNYIPSIKFRFIDINPTCVNLGEKILIAYNEIN